MAHWIPQQPIGFRLCHELTGLLSGIKADTVINPMETDRIVRWLAAAQPHRHIAPFRDVVDALEHALADRILTFEETEDIHFLVGRYTTVNPHFDGIRSSVQVLMGIVAGIGADRTLNLQEAAELQHWLRASSHLTGVWPYDECQNIATDALDGTLDPAAGEYLHELSAQFPIGGHLDTDTGELVPQVVTGVCTPNPAIEFVAKHFVVTGDSERADREQIEQLILDREGLPHPRITKKTHYLIVCDGGNPLWAFGAYGRKIEKAVELQREGHPLLIVHEPDFWKAIGN